MLPETEMVFCPTCERENLVEAPPCLDGHETCPDRACVECGSALVLDAGLLALAFPSRRRPSRPHRNVA